MKKKTGRFILCGILILSSLLLTVYFKPQDIFSNTPVYTDDYALHFSQCLTTKKFLAAFGKCWAYDPFFLAGFPNGSLANADNKAWELFYAALSPLLGYGFAYKLYVLLFFLLYPLFMYAAIRNFYFSRAAALTGAFIGILFFHLSLCVNLVSWGMLSYVFVCFYSLYVLSLFWRLLQEFTLWRYALTACGLALMALMHILSAVHLFVPLAALYIASARRLSAVRHALIMAIPILVLLVNSFWLVPVVEFFDDKTTRPENYEFTLQIKNPFEPLKVYIEQRRSRDHSVPLLNNTFIDVAILLFGAAGLYFWYRDRRRVLWLSFILGIPFVFFIAYYGSHSTFLAPLQPERFTIPLSLLLLIPASCSLTVFIRNVFHGKRPLAVCFLCALAFALLYKPVIRPFGLFYKYKLYLLNTEFPRQLDLLLDVLDRETTLSGRILIEDSEAQGQKKEEYYGGHYPALFPERVKREYLCGPRPMYPVKHSYASFYSGILFEKNIEAYTREDLEHCFSVYNVKWIVSWLPKSKDFFGRFPDYITKIADIDKFSVYVVNRQPSYFLKGQGIITADYNRIDLSNVRPQDGEIIIAYHWMKKFRAVPAAVIEPVSLAGDPVGFIKIKNPPEAFSLVTAY